MNFNNRKLYFCQTCKSSEARYATVIWFSFPSSRPSTASSGNLCFYFWFFIVLFSYCPLGEIKKGDPKRKVYTHSIESKP